MAPSISGVNGAKSFIKSYSNITFLLFYISDWKNLVTVSLNNIKKAIETSSRKEK